METRQDPYCESAPGKRSSRPNPPRPVLPLTRTIRSQDACGCPDSRRWGSVLARASVYQVAHRVFHIRSPLNPWRDPILQSRQLRLQGCWRGEGSGSPGFRMPWDLPGDSGGAGGLLRRGPAGRGPLAPGEQFKAGRLAGAPGSLGAGGDGGLGDAGVHFSPKGLPGRTRSCAGTAGTSPLSPAAGGLSSCRGLRPPGRQAMERTYFKKMGNHLPLNQESGLIVNCSPSLYLAIY